MLDLRNVPWNKRLQMLRAFKDWSQEEAASRCGTTQKAYWLWEKGKVYPRGNSQKAVAMAFGVPVEEIFGKETA